MTQRHEHIAHDADPVDKHVGARIRCARRGLDLSQGQLARMIGVTFQQLQKYESGANRISGSRLYKLACAVRWPIEAFYDGLPNPTQDQQAALPPPANLALEDSLGAVPELAEVFRLPTHMQKSLQTVLRTMLDALPKAA